MHIFNAHLHGRFPSCWGGLGLSLLNIVTSYFYCIASLHLFIAYLYCISLLSRCCLLLFGSWVDLWSFGNVFVRFLAVLEWSEGCFGRSFGGLGLLGALGPLLGDLGSVLAGLGRSWAALGRFWAALGSLLARLGPLLARLGPLLARLGPLLGRSRAARGAVLGALGAILAALGGLLGALGGTLGHQNRFSSGLGCKNRFFKKHRKT